MTPIKNAVELESVLRIRLDMDRMEDYWTPERKRQLVADHLEDMVAKGMIPPGCVVFDPPGWCRSMAARLFVTWDGGWSITEMCRAVMAPYVMRPRPGSVPVSAYLRQLERTPAAVIASVEDEERVAALHQMAVRASLQPSLLERLKEAKALVKEETGKDDDNPAESRAGLKNGYWASGSPLGLAQALATLPFFTQPRPCDNVPLPKWRFQWS